MSTFKMHSLGVLEPQCLPITIPILVGMHPGSPSQRWVLLGTGVLGDQG